jgi:hypothetical protein
MRLQISDDLIDPSIRAVGKWTKVFAGEPKRLFHTLSNFTSRKVPIWRFPQDTKNWNNNITFIGHDRFSFVYSASTTAIVAHGFPAGGAAPACSG